jgi:hypothetical protein
MVFRHPTMPSIILPTGPELTLGDAVAQIVARGIDITDFMAHYPTDEFG